MTQRSHHSHLRRLIGQEPRRPDTRFWRTLSELVLGSVAVVLLVVGFGGAFAAGHLSFQTTKRLAAGAVLVPGAETVAAHAPRPVPARDEDQK